MLRNVSASINKLKPKEVRRSSVKAAKNCFDYSLSKLSSTKWPYPLRSRDTLPLALVKPAELAGRPVID